MWNETEGLVKERNDDTFLILENLRIGSKPDVNINGASLVFAASTELFLGLNAKCPT